MNHPATYWRQDLVLQLDEAAAGAEASFLSSGMDPGYSRDPAIHCARAGLPAGQRMPSQAMSLEVPDWQDPFRSVRS